MTYTVHGTPGWIVTLLAILGALYIYDGAENWIRERISLDLHLLWRVIPRRFKLSIRWDRPSAPVTLADGRDGVILATYECDGAPGPVALVQPCDEDADLGPAEWLPLTALTPVPRHSFRETLRTLRGREDEKA